MLGHPSRGDRHLEWEVEAPRPGDRHRGWAPRQRRDAGAAHDGDHPPVEVGGRKLAEEESSPADRAAHDGPYGRVAFLLDDLEGGGVQRMTLVLAREFARHGHPVDVLACRAGGAFESLVASSVRLLELMPARVFESCRVAWRGDRRLGVTVASDLLLRRRRSSRGDRLSALVGYLERERPACLISATPRINVLAVTAAKAATGTVHTIVTERMSLAAKLGDPGQGRWRSLLPVMRHGYTLADRVVAVSEDLADDVALQLGLPRDRIHAIYNPVVGPDLEEQIAQPVEDPWFTPGAPPVVLSAGRMSKQKDFATLLQAFAIVRHDLRCRLVILGRSHDDKGGEKRRQRLLELAHRLGVANHVRLPGFVTNPFPYMAKASVFVLSSRYEGLPGVLIQAMGCGTPVVSTACPTGPREILQEGRYGRLVPVGDAAAMAKAIRDTLESPPPREWLAQRARFFSVERSFERYRELAFGDDEPRGRALPVS